MLAGDGVGSADAASHNQGRSKDAAGGPRAQGDDKSPELGYGYAEKVSGSEPIVQHVADGVVTCAENLRIEVSDDA